MATTQRPPLSARSDSQGQRADADNGADTFPLHSSWPVRDGPVHGSANGKAAGLEGDRLSQLASVIEGEIVPRLMLAHRAPVAPAVPVEGAGTIGRREVLDFARLVIANDAAVAYSYVETLRAQGTPTETILLQLLAPAARRLGKLWEEDRVDFTQVTVALCALQQVMRQLGGANPSEIEARETVHRVLLAPAPGDQHTFGLMMVAEFFRRAGWDVAGECAMSGDELCAMVRRDWFAVVGLSACSCTPMDDLASAIRMIRAASRNRRVNIMVGGRVFIDDPSLVGDMGADATAEDGRAAVRHAESVVASARHN